MIASDVSPIVVKSVLAFCLIALANGHAAGDEPSKGGDKSSRLAQVHGTVTYTGTLMKPVDVPEAGTSRQLIEVDRKSKGLKDAVVWLDGVPASDTSGSLVHREPVVMDQINYFFVPHVLAVEAGRKVVFTNSDGANHGVLASSLEAKNRFNVVTPPGGRYSHRFTVSSHPVGIGCPVHGAMAAWIYVFDHPYFAVTNEKGEFKIPSVPPGRYTLRVRHANGGMDRKEEVIAGNQKTSCIRVEFGEGDRNARDNSRTR